MSESRVTLAMTKRDLVEVQRAMAEIHIIIGKACNRSIAIQTALGLSFGLPDLTFHGALDKINRLIAAMDRAEVTDA